MKKSFFRTSAFSALLLTLFATAGTSCTDKAKKNRLDFPAVMAVDSVYRRVFVIDSQLNELHLIDPETNEVAGDKKDPLLDIKDPPLLPLAPSQAVVVPLPEGVSRLFVIGGKAGVLNQISVIDYDEAQGIRAAPFSPIHVSGAVSDVVAGLAFDAQSGLVFASVANTGEIRAYHSLTGFEDSLSPLHVDGTPGKMSVDTGSGWLAVSNATLAEVAFFKLADLGAAPLYVDAGSFTYDVAIVSQGSDLALFVSGAQKNLARVFGMEAATLANVSVLFELQPVLPTETLPDPNFVTGTLNQIEAGILPDGRIAGFYTQSSGDLLALNLNAEANAVTPTLIAVGALSGEGIDALLNADGRMGQIYYASPGIGAVTVVDPVSNLFVDQIP